MNVRGTKLMAINIISSLQIWQNVQILWTMYKIMSCFNKSLSVNANGGGKLQLAE